jgi:hypothetical protein
MQRNPKFKQIFQIDKITNRDSLDASNANYDQDGYGEEEEENEDNGYDDAGLENYYSHD